MNKQHKISYDYYGDTRDIFSIIKDSEWAVFLCSNHDKFQDERYYILSANPIEKIISLNVMFSATIVKRSPQMLLFIN